MDVFRVRDRLIEDYREFTGSFVDIHDKNIREHVAERMARGYQWPDPWLSLNPNFASGGTITDLVPKGCCTPSASGSSGSRTTTPARAGRSGCTSISARPSRRRAPASSYVLTTGTGSGKSLAYIVPIVDHVLRGQGGWDDRPGIKAIVVYPMNALANSQLGELEKFLRDGYREGREPVTFARYTGQESTRTTRAGSSPTRRTSC